MLLLEKKRKVPIRLLVFHADVDLPWIKRACRITFQTLVLTLNIRLDFRQGPLLFLPVNCQEANRGGVIGVVLHSQRDWPPGFRPSTNLTIKKTQFISDLVRKKRNKSNSYLVKLKSHQGFNEGTLSTCLVSNYNYCRRIKWLVKILSKTVKKVVRLIKLFTISF